MKKRSIDAAAEGLPGGDRCGEPSVPATPISPSKFEKPSGSDASGEITEPAKPLKHAKPAKPSKPEAIGKHYLYVLECADGTLYTGYTVDVEQRVAAHSEGRGAKYTRSHRPVKLVASAEFETKHAAMSAEYRFKRLSRAEKLALLDESAHRPLGRVLEERFGIGGSDSEVS